jgi:hypothetical protein
MHARARRAGRRLAIGAILVSGVLMTPVALLHADELPALRGDAVSGAGVYKRNCRGVDGQVDGLVFMPHVNNLTKKGYTDQLPDSHLRHVILNGGESVGKSAYMPSFEGALTEQQIADVIDHIRTLPTD